MEGKLNMICKHCAGKMRQFDFIRVYIKELHCSAVTFTHQMYIHDKERQAFCEFKNWINFLLHVLSFLCSMQCCGILALVIRLTYWPLGNLNEILDM